LQLRDLAAKSGGLGLAAEQCLLAGHDRVAEGRVLEPVRVPHALQRDAVRGGGGLDRRGVAEEGLAASGGAWLRGLSVSWGQAGGEGPTAATSPLMLVFSDLLRPDAGHPGFH